MDWVQRPSCLIKWSKNHKCFKWRLYTMILELNVNVCIHQTWHFKGKLHISIKLLSVLISWKVFSYLFSNWRWQQYCNMYYMIEGVNQQHFIKENLSINAKMFQRLLSLNKMTFDISVSIKNVLHLLYSYW